MEGSIVQEVRKDKVKPFLLINKTQLPWMSVQYVTLRKYFSHPSLVVYSSATPPIKLELEQQICGRLLIASHLDESLWWANQKHWVAVRSHLLHSFSQLHSAAAPFTSHDNLPNYAEPKPFSWAKPACWFYFLCCFWANSRQVFPFSPFWASPSLGFHVILKTLMGSLRLW